jgi:hypothetical protein
MVDPATLHSMASGLEYAADMVDMELTVRPSALRACAIHARNAADDISRLEAVLAECRSAICKACGASFFRGDQYVINADGEASCGQKYGDECVSTWPCYAHRAGKSGT